MSRMRYLQNITGFQGVANSGVGTLNMFPNLRYHAVSLFVTVNGALADPTTAISNLKLKVGGVTIRDVSPSQVIRLAKMYGIIPATGEIPIFFSEPWFEDPRIAESFSWDMYGQGLFTIEATFLNPGAGAVAIQNVVAQVDTERNTIRGADGKPKAFLRILKMKTQTFVYAGAGLLGNTTLDRTLPIRRILCDASTGTVSTVEVIADSVSIYNQMTTAQLSAVYAQEKLDNTQFTLPLVFDFDNLGRSKLICNNLEVRLTASAGNTMSYMIVQEADRFA